MVSAIKGVMKLGGLTASNRLHLATGRSTLLKLLREYSNATYKAGGLKLMKVVITGTSRGIGSELARIAKQAGHDVLAVDRKVVDLRDPEAAAKIGEMCKPWGVVDILVNNAGIYRKGTSREDFQESFLVNSIVPFEITQALALYLKKSTHPRVVHITSLMGSIADNGSGGSYAYRASKSALNMINKCLTVDCPWLTTQVIHPGWVQTDMGGEGAPTPITESAQGIWLQIEKLDKAASGGFIDFRGQELPW